MTEEALLKMTPEDALDRLVQGNKRFLEEIRKSCPHEEDEEEQEQEQVVEPKRDLCDFISKTSSVGQFPFAVVLSCIDSRMPTETLFDQFIGDIFNARIAGNFVNRDILGSMEFACGRLNETGKLIGAKLILVLGHNHCGAIAGAAASVHPECFNKNYEVESVDDNLGPMLKELEPAVKGTKPEDPDLNECKTKEWQQDFVNRAAKTNVELTKENIICMSNALKKLVEDDKVIIRGAMYDITNGRVTLLDE